MFWKLFKKNSPKVTKDTMSRGFEYYREYLRSHDIQSTYNAAEITISYLELMDKINPDICAGQVLDETSIPCKRETLKNAFKWLLYSEDAPSFFNMSKQKYKQLALTHYLLLSRFLPGIGQVALGSTEYYSQNEGKTEVELKVLQNKLDKFEVLAKVERYKLFSEIEYYFPFSTSQEFNSLFEMDLVNRAASLGKYCLPENLVEAGEHILKMIGLNLYDKFFRLGNDDQTLMSDEKICFDLSGLNKKLFHDKQFESKNTLFMEKVNNEGKVYSARGTSFVVVISLCSHYIAFKLNSSEDKVDSEKMSRNVSGLFLSFLRDADKDEIIALGLERARDIYLADPPNRLMARVSELTKEFCLSSSCEEDDRCSQDIFELFNELLESFQIKEESDPDAKSNDGREYL
jgi:hypothetical protein